MSEGKCRTIVSARSLGRCEARIQDACYGQAMSKHHRRKVSQGGEWAASNVLDVCGDGTRGCHGWIEANPKVARDRGLWCFTGDDPARTPVLMTYQGRPGWYLLDDDGGVTPAVMQRSP